jgi:L,D-peptidoglycan transpeptidase YkuD (ErfK/YbiS/YcfS/YnhG family)
MVGCVPSEPAVRPEPAVPAVAAAPPVPPVRPVPAVPSPAVVVLAVLALVGGLLAGAPVPARAGSGATAPVRATGAADLPAYHPSRLAHLGDARQVVVVTAPAWSARRATLRAYGQRADGSWRRDLDAGRVWLGANGLVAAGRRRQSTWTTPAGTFGLPFAFGTGTDPGTALHYEQVDARDWWPYDPRDPATYNVWQQRRGAAADWRTSWAEDLSSFGRQYRHGVVIDFNLPAGVHWSGGERVASRPADTRRGGGIFLHVQARAPAERPTAGCVAMPPARMVALLRWLDPASRPVVVIGPRSAIDRM